MPRIAPARKIRLALGVFVALLPLQALGVGALPSNLKLCRTVVAAEQSLELLLEEVRPENERATLEPWFQTPEELGLEPIALERSLQRSVEAEDGSAVQLGSGAPGGVFWTRSQHDGLPRVFKPILGGGLWLAKGVVLSAHYVLSTLGLAPHLYGFVGAQELGRSADAWGVSAPLARVWKRSVAVVMEQLTDAWDLEQIERVHPDPLLLRDWDVARIRSEISAVFDVLTRMGVCAFEVQFLLSRSGAPYAIDLDNIYRASPDEVTTCNGSERAHVSKRVDELERMVMAARYNTR